MNSGLIFQEKPV